MSDPNLPKVDRVASSFRDPAGFVLIDSGRVLRVLSEEGALNYRTAAGCGLIAALEEGGLLLPLKETDLSPLAFGGEVNGCVLEQDRLPFVSYPYEWCFEGLKAAALLHLDVQLLAARFAFTLKDATAFNVQFIGTKPYFIDIGSFIPCKSGEYWRGYRQFCEQFLNPLLLQSATGVPFNDLYRGRARGVPTDHLAKLLRLHHRLSPHTLFHVVLHARLDARATTPSMSRTEKKVISSHAQEVLVRDLRRWIASLPLKSERSAWIDYTTTRNYNQSELKRKLAFVRQWTMRWGAATVLDLGSNTGEAARIAVEAGASHVVGLEKDSAAANISFVEAKKSGLPLLPLVMDLTNPSPAQGWHNKEWSNLKDRNGSDTVYSLAILHHLVLAEGIPLEHAIAWICGLGRRGIIEFVSPEDPMATAMRDRLKNPAIVYSKEHFLAQLSRHANVIDEMSLIETGRCIFAYEVP